MIQINSIFKSYGGRRVLKDISLNFNSGQTHVLLGASGSGKSTLLRMIMGLIHPDSGSIAIDEDVMEPSSQLRLARNIGYVLQEGGLFPHLSARENISLVARVMGWKKPDIEARIEELATVVGLDAPTLNQFPRQLSGGQRQRAAVMRAIFLDPKVLLLDEPLGALDPIVRSRLQGELREIFLKLGKLVVLVTHDIGEAAFFGNTVTLLYEGQVLQHGSFQELVEKPKHDYVTEFIQAQRVLYRPGVL